jgi:TP901 family phage tail tape measure protein
MSNVVTQWTAEFVDNISSPVEGVTSAATKASEAIDGIKRATRETNEEIKKLSAMDLKATADAIRDLTRQFEDLMQPGMDFEVRMKEVQAVTRQTDDEMKSMGDSARKLAKDFGGEASGSLESFGAIIARFGPDIAKDNDAMASMGNSVMTLSKLMKNDPVGAMDALTTAMLQFGVDINNPKVAAAEMVRMMNVMAAAGNEGASEVADTAEALKQVGVVARQSNVSVEETNAALQALAQGGRIGGEAGVSLRNVLSKMAGIDIIPRKAREKLQQLGVDYDIVSDKTLPFTERLKELKKVQADATLAAQIFGVENVAAANILLDSIGPQEEMTRAITGTNAAYESAETVMSSQAEKMSRMNAWLDDLKISFFNVAGSITPFVSGLGTVAFTIANMAVAAVGIKQLIGFVKSLTLATKLQTAAQWLLNIAMDANPVGLIILAISALIAIIAVAISHYDQFGAALLIPLGAIGLFVNAVMALKKNWDSVVEAFNKDGITGAIKRIGIVLFDAVLYPVQQLLEILSYIPGIGKFASAGADRIAELRKGFNLAVAEPQAPGDADPLPLYVPGPLKTFQMSGNPLPVAKTPAPTKDNRSGPEGDGVKLGGSGSGGKSIDMNITNNFNGFKSTKDVAEAIIKEVNNRLSDGLAVAG